MMIDKVEIQLLLLADGIGAERALKAVRVLVVLPVGFEGAARLKVARGAVLNPRLRTGRLGRVGVLVRPPKSLSCHFKFQLVFLCRHPDWPITGGNIDLKQLKIEIN